MRVYSDTSLLRKMRMFRGFLAVCVCAAALGGCALNKIADGPAPDIYVLTPATSLPGEDLSRSSAQLLVDEFKAAAVIDTARIVFQPSVNEVKYYARARWADRAPNMIQDLLVATLQNSGRFAAVARANSELMGDYMLMGDIRSFAAVEEEGRTQVRILLLVQLVRANDRAIAASRSFSANVAPMGSGMKAVVAAYDAALRQVLDEISVWTHANTPKAPRAAIAPGTRDHGGAMILPAPRATLPEDEEDY